MNIISNLLDCFQIHTFMYAASVSAMVRSNSARALRRWAKLSFTRLSFSVSTRMSCCRRAFSDSSCWIRRFKSSLLEHSSSIPEKNNKDKRGHHWKWLGNFSPYPCFLYVALHSCCDSREGVYINGRWKLAQHFLLLIHAIKNKGWGWCINVVYAQNCQWMCTQFYICAHSQTDTNTIEGKNISPSVNLLYFPNIFQAMFNRDKKFSQYFLLLLFFLQEKSLSF